MSGSTNYRQFNPGPNNIETDAQYAADIIRQEGIVPGVLPSPVLNKVIYQLAAMCTGLATMLANKGYVVNDGSANVGGNDFTALVAVLSNLLTTADLAGMILEYGTDVGSANAYAVTYSPVVSSLTDGMVLLFKATNPNTGASTFSPNGLAAQPIWGRALSALQGGEIVGLSAIQWNSTINSTGAWVLLFSCGAAQVPDATASKHAVNQEAGDARYMQPVALQQGTNDYAADTGTANTYAAALTPAMTSVGAGSRARVKITHTNTGASTFAPNGLTPVAITIAGAALAGGELPTGYIADLEHNGTSWQLQSVPGNYVNSAGSNYPVSTRWPEILTGTNQLVVTAGSGNVVIGAGQLFNIRDAIQINTSSFLTAALTFATAASKVYHLRFANKVGATFSNMGASFYSSHSILDRSFYLADLADTAYNPSVLAENDPAFDSQLDDMLIAKVTTDGSNVATIVTLRNTNKRYNYSSRRTRSSWAFSASLTAITGITAFVNDSARSFLATVTGTFGIDGRSTENSAWVKLQQNGTTIAEGFNNSATSQTTGNTTTPLEGKALILRGDAVGAYGIMAGGGAAPLLDSDHPSSSVTTDLGELGSNLIVNEN